MEMETTMAKGIQATDENTQYDAACKRLLSEKIILAWIMKSCLEEYRDCNVKDIAEQYIEGQPKVGEVPVAPDETNREPMIRGLNTEDVSLTEGTVKYDIRFLAVIPGTDELVQMIVNVESQNRYNPGYPLTKRGIYYCSRMISAQHGTEFTHSQYGKIKKVCSIWVCANPPEERKNTITRYRIAEENLIGCAKEAVQNYDLLSLVMICLGDPAETSTEGDGAVLKLLNVLLSPERDAVEKQRVMQEEFDIPMTQTLETEVQQMCNLSQGVEEKGIEKGLARGRAEGVAEGLLSALRSLMGNTGWSVEKAMDALSIPAADRPKYADLLQKQ